METLFYYIALNAALFGGLYALGKTIEYSVWNLIQNYDDIIERFSK